MIIIAQRSMKNLTVPGLRQLPDLALLRSGCGGQHVEGGGVPFFLRFEMVKSCFVLISLSLSLSMSAMMFSWEEGSS